MKLTALHTHEERISLLNEVAQSFFDRARTYDETGQFPFENIEDLRRIHYPALVIPKRYGGAEISLTEMLKFQELIASFDGSTALAIGWHMGITKNISENNVWKKATYEKFARDVVENGALINNASTERGTGSPTRGGRPETTAERRGDKWILHGRKSFTTLAPVLDYFVVSASIEGTDKVGSFLVRRDTRGVTIDETWDSIAMKATGSHDLCLEHVVLQEENFLHELKPGKKRAQGWLLHIPACYLGIAKAAQREALQFVTSYAPNSLEKGKTIADTYNVQQKLGEIELRLIESTTILYAVAQKWDESEERVRETMKEELGAVKISVVNNALSVVDLAMRIAGAHSLSASSPLQRYYRDVRAGLHNPPMEDMMLLALAKKSLQRANDGAYV